jgi:hypothetical protein
MNSMKKLLYARGEFIYVQWCCLREASSDSQNADEALRTPPKIPTATRILAYRSHNEGHRPSTINQGFSPLQEETLGTGDGSPTTTSTFNTKAR